MTAWRPYNLADGTRIPSVTTICGRFKQADALVAWAWQQGRDGKDFRETRDKAADAGSCAHAMIEAHIKGESFVPQGWGEEALAKAQVAFNAFKLWADGTRLQPHASEVRMVSETLRIGGTCDAVVSINGTLAIADWKSGNIYADHLYQVAAYALLWDELHPNEPITGGFHLCRFNRDSGDFSHSHFAELEEAKRGFLLMRDLYQIDLTIKKRAR